MLNLLQHRGFAMANETEIKLSLSTRTAGQLAKHAMLAGIASHRQLLINTYYDTPDKRLRHERIVVRHRQKGATVPADRQDGAGAQLAGSRSEASGRFPADAESSTFQR
jgi:hypothetical protein